MEEGEIEVESILPISLDDVTPELARASGFKGVVDLLKVAKHGKGENLYLVRFPFVPPERTVRSGGSPRSRRAARARLASGRTTGARIAGTAGALTAARRRG
jgi:hypothetical protein